jgi:hypothetical protein
MQHYQCPAGFAQRGAGPDQARLRVHAREIAERLFVHDEDQADGFGMQESL